MTHVFNSAKNIINILIDQKNIPRNEVSEEEIQSAIKKIKLLDEFNSLKESDYDKLLKSLLADYRIKTGSISELSEDLPKWVNEFRAKNEMPLWERYKNLMSKDPSFPTTELDDFTDKILDKCVDPTIQADWDRRGMVVGHVQSGKTSNYIGLINKASDAGYKLIIVIAGTISSLRRQTQERIDEGFIGRDSSLEHTNRSKVIGVGKEHVNKDIYSFTSTIYERGKDGDFNQSIATRLNIPLGNNPVVLVIKKNKSILENLIEWLSNSDNIKQIGEDKKLINCPALVIDDEADAASVNASKSLAEIKTINRLIRTLLTLFSQKTFIGYTATPYANLFIPQEFKKNLRTDIKGQSFLVGDDLFPRDFIINIKAPENYIGSSKIFGSPADSGNESEPLDIFRPIYKEDYDPPFFSKLNRENKLILPDEIPENLEKALKSFFITCAIRKLRGQGNQHNSMLVHVALLVAWIDRVAKLVNDKLIYFKDCIEANDTEFLESLKEIFERDYCNTTKSVIENLSYEDPEIKVHDWESVKENLRYAILKIEVRAVHGRTNTSSLEYHNIEEINYDNYKDGFSVIAVGGNKLSRGITLKGLSVSYYLRTTKMYDSLMQMGRWFGYRPGYVDLCRLYTNETIYNWFNHVSLATEEMRLDFDELTAMNKKPKDFRLKVRNHSGLLTITSVAKLHFTKEIKVSFSNTNPQTYLLSKDQSVISKNYETFSKFFKKLGKPESDNIVKYNDKIKYLKYNDIEIDPLCEFLQDYRSVTPKIENSDFADYIKKQSNIYRWNLVLVCNTDNKPKLKDKSQNIYYHKLIIDNTEYVLGQSVRNEKQQLENYHISKNQIDDLKDRQIDLGTNYKTNGQIKTERSNSKQGLILIYALDERGANIQTDKHIPIIAYSLHFPEIKNEKKITYTSTIYDDFGDDIMGEENEE